MPLTVRCHELIMALNSFFCAELLGGALPFSRQASRALIKSIATDGISSQERVKTLVGSADVHRKCLEEDEEREWLDGNGIHCRKRMTNFLTQLF
jgi:hypothetical protein